MFHSGKYSNNLSLTDYSVLLSQRLSQLRAEAHLSQEAVAKRAKISTYTYLKFEKGESKPGTPMNPNLATLISIAKVFDISVWKLLKFDDGESNIKKAE